jgi:hypothetical protein
MNFRTKKSTWGDGTGMCPRFVCFFVIPGGRSLITTRAPPPISKSPCFHKFGGGGFLFESDLSSVITRRSIYQMQNTTIVFPASTHHNTGWPLSCRCRSNFIVFILCYLSFSFFYVVAVVVVSGLDGFIFFLFVCGWFSSWQIQLCLFVLRWIIKPLMERVDSKKNRRTEWLKMQNTVGLFISWCVARATSERLDEWMNEWDVLLRWRWLWRRDHKLD